MLCAVAVAACGRVGFDETGAGSVTFDRASSTTATEVSALSWNLTVDPGAVELLVFVALRTAFDGPPEVSSVGYGGSALVRLATACPTCGPDGLNRYELWALDDPPAGTATVDVTIAGMVDGASGLASSYAGDHPATLDATGAGFGTSAAPALSWTPSPDARWAVAGAMNQAGYAMALVPGSDEVARSPTVCDDTNWEGQAAADRLALAGGSASFTWTIGVGSGANCQLIAESRNWIALGAAFE